MKLANPLAENKNFFLLFEVKSVNFMMTVKILFGHTAEHQNIIHLITANSILITNDV